MSPPGPKPSDASLPLPYQWHPGAPPTLYFQPFLHPAFPGKDGSLPSSSKCFCLLSGKSLTLSPDLSSSSRPGMKVPCCS